jgi:hypothetical protein
MRQVELAQRQPSEKDTGAIILGLVKTAKALQMYGADHVTFRHFFSPFYKNLSAFLKEYHEVRFQIEQYAILYEDRVLYEEHEKDMSIPFRLFRDGIRNIDFSEGLSSDEILLFLDIISQPLNEYDIAIGLWESDFTHIDFCVVDEDDELYNYDIPNVPTEDVDYDQKMSALLKKEEIDLDMPLTSQLRPDELEKLKIDISDAEHDATLPLIVAVLEEFIGTDASQDIIDGFRNILKLCLDLRDFSNARRIITKLQNCHSINVLETLEDEEIIVGFREVVTTAQDSIFDEFIQFITFLSKKSIPYLFKMMAGVTRQDRLERLQKKIIDIAQNDPSLIATALSSEDHIVVIHAITVLAMMKTQEVASYLTPLVHHRDLEVRAKVVTALEYSGVPSIIVAFLNDPQSDVRIKALRALTNMKYPKVYPKLLQTMQGNDFLTAELNEQKAFFNCLVANGSDTLGADLKKILYKKMLFGNEGYRAVRKLAAIALSDIGSEEALEILRQGTQTKLKDIKTACNMALRRKQRNSNE